MNCRSSAPFPSILTSMLTCRYASEVKGEFYMFIDVSECVGKPTLLALVSGTVARTLETCDDKQIISEALQVRSSVHSLHHLV